MNEFHTCLRSCNDKFQLFKSVFTVKMLQNVHGENVECVLGEYTILFPVIRILGTLAHVINNFVAELLFSKDLFGMLIAFESIDRWRFHGR